MATSNEPLGSGSPGVLLVNSRNLDHLIQDPAHQIPDRFGNPRRTWAGVEYGVEEKINEVANAAATPLVGSIAEGITRTSSTENKFFKVIPNGPDNLRRSILFENVAGTAVPRDVQISRDDVARSELVNSNLKWSDYPFAITDENLIPVIAVKDDGFAHVVTNELPGGDLLHHLYRYGVFDSETGDLLHGYTWDGGVALGGSRMLDDEFRYVWTDESGNVVFGLRWDGSFYPGTADTDTVLYTKGPEGKRTIWAWMNGLPYQLTSTGDAWSPRLAGPVVQWLSAEKGGVVSRSAPLPDTSLFAPFVTRALHLVSYGQSLSIGSYTTPFNTAPHCANRLLTLRQGVMAYSQSAALTESAVIPLKPLASVQREAPVVAMATELLDKDWLDSDAAVIGSAHGNGGQSIAQLERESVFYNNLITAVTYTCGFVKQQGLQYSVPFIDWVQGEADRKLPAGEYTAQLMQLRQHLQEDIAAATGDDYPVPVLLDQISNATAYNMTASFVPLEQLQIALDHPALFTCAGPKYWLETVDDGVHLTTESSQRLGSLHARAAAAMLDGRQWLPTHCTAAKRHGRVVTLTFYTPVAPLVLDTGAVSDPGQYGLRWIDDNASATIISAVVNSDNTVTVTLDTEPTGNNPMIGIADTGVSGAHGGPFTGARSNLRDSASGTDITGQPLYNWACHQRITVTEEEQ